LSSRNQVSDAGGHVVQARTINGGVHLTDAKPAPNVNEIGVYLRPDRAEVHFRVGTTEWFQLTITNRTPRDRRLSLRFESASTTGLRWHHEDAATPEVLTVPADRSLPLRLKVTCTATDFAGPDVLKVLAGELDARTGERTWWSSDPLPIQIGRAPGLDAVLEQPDDVYDSGTYETVVTLTNTGNTSLAGRLHLRTEFDGVEHPDWLDSDKVTIIDGPDFDLRPGAPATDLRVAVELPVSPLLERTWRVPLAVHVDCDDLPPVDREFTLTQSGELDALREWGRTPDPWKRRTIVVGAISLLVLGITLGAQVGGPSDGTTTPSAQSNAAVSAPADVQLPYSRMPCEQGKSVLVLHSLEESAAAADVKLLLDYETMWLGQRLPGDKLPDGAKVRLSTRQDTCPKVLQGSTPDRDTDKRYSRFVWLGPVPSDRAPALCDDLHKVTWKNCSPVGVA
jgi:hypothetical protein